MVRPPSGSTLTGVVPSGTWKAKDGVYVIIGGNGNSGASQQAEHFWFDARPFRQRRPMR